MKLKDSLIAATAVLIVVMLGYVWFAPAGVKQVPQLNLTTIDGSKLTLQDFRGQPVLVTFWATTCSGCVEEMPHLVELYNKLHPKGFNLVAISMDYDPPNQVIALVEQRQLPYTIALDISGEASKAFGNVRLTPTNFLIDADGTIVYQKIGDLDMPSLTARIESLLNKQQASL